MKKILVVYGSIGLGHKVVAENIGGELKNYPGVEVSFLDTMELYKDKLIKSSGSLYEYVVKHAPFIWRFLYTNKFFQMLSLPLRVPLASLKTRKFQNYLYQFQPDLILTTHPTATALTMGLKKKGIYKGPVVTTFSDFHFQPYWVYKGVDKYLVMTEEQKWEVVRRGYKPEQVEITGLPVNAVFAKEYDAAAVYAKYRLLKSKPVVLVMGGSRGWGIKAEDIRALLGSNLEFQTVVVTGLNSALQKELDDLASKQSGSLKVLGNWAPEEVAELYSIAKILVTKPGGLSIAQAILKYLPMVLVNPFPAMEELNQDYLVKRGGAVAAKNPHQMISWVERLLQDKKLYADMKTALKRLSAPDAAKNAARAVFDILNAEY